MGGSGKFWYNPKIDQRFLEPFLLSFTLERNVVLWDSGELFHGHWSDENVKLNHNLYWQRNGKPIDFNSLG